MEDISQALTISRSFPHLQRAGSSSSSRSILAEQPISYEEQQQWQPILHASNQVVLYNPRSHALSITSTSNSATLASGVVVARRQRREEAAASVGTCPYCKQNLPPGFRNFSRHGHGAQEVDGEPGWEEYEHLDSSEEDDESSGIETLAGETMDPAIQSRASDYFRLLAIVNETSSRSASPGSTGYRDERRSRSRSNRRDRTPDNRSSRGAFPAEKMAEGYFRTFFREEYKLGMGANGSVFLCQHVLDGNSLGHFAVKKIAVGESHSYLLKILREVRLLERLHHPNIITYHHAWLENSQFSSFGPRIPTLHVLMQWAEGGSLDDFIDVRLGRKPAHIHMHPLMSSTTSSIFGPTSTATSPMSTTGELPEDDHAEGPTTPTPSHNPRLGASGGRRAHFTESPGVNVAGPSVSGVASPGGGGGSSKSEDPQSRTARIKAFRAYQKAPPEERERMRREMESTVSLGSGGVTAPGLGPAGGRAEWTAVHLLSAQEVHSLFRDVVEGLAFLHDKSILHLDLKPGNVLLTWDEGKLIPRAMLSDFGTSRDMINSSRMQRSGNTGTLEYTAPESLPSPDTGKLQQIDSKADMWSLGMILHKLLFFKLPYRYAATGDANGEPISRNEEGEKMDRLEKEVLDYPGFKSTPAVVTGFEARRLPRAFLVLLENLLHKSPLGRPSCERVSTAIKEGKLDPLSDAPSSENLPLARPWSTDSSPPSTSNLNTVGDCEQEHTAEENEHETLLYAAERSILALPSPIEILGPEEGSWRAWISWNSWERYARNALLGRGANDVKRKGKKDRRNASRRAFFRRTARTGLLVMKLFTIAPGTSWAWGDSESFYGQQIDPWIVRALVLAAVLDGVVYHDDSDWKSRGIGGPGSPEKDFNTPGASSPLRRLNLMMLIPPFHHDVWITATLAIFHAFVLFVFDCPGFDWYLLSMVSALGVIIFL